MKYLALITILFAFISCEKENDCENGIRDSGETDIDCGGQCEACNYMSDECKITFEIEFDAAVNNGFLGVQYLDGEQKGSTINNPIIDSYFKKTIQPSYFKDASEAFEFSAEIYTTYECYTNVQSSGSSFYTSGKITWYDYLGNFIFEESFEIARTTDSSSPSYPDDIEKFYKSTYSCN